jgi:outer membrane protein
MGADLESSPVLADSLAFHPLGRPIQAYLDQAKSQRPELVAARHRVRAAQNQASSAEGSLRPQVYGFAMADAFRPRDAMGNSAGYTVGLTVSLPVFDGGMRRSELAAARAMAARAGAEASRLELQVAKEVRQAFLDSETAALTYEAAGIAVAAAEAAHDVIAIRVAEGKSVLLEQLDALAALSRARSNLARAISDHELAVARLRRAAGDTREQNP